MYICSIVWYDTCMIKGWLVLHRRKGGEAVLDFSFSEFYQFIITVLGMILSFLAGRATREGKTDNDK